MKGGYKMRKILACLLILAFVFSGIAQAMPTLTETGEIRGQGKYPFEPHRTFRLVRYVPLGTGTTENKYLNRLTPDHLVRWVSGAKSGDGVSVCDSFVSNDNRIAGVIVSTILTPEPGNYSNSATQDVGERNWGWLQTYGLARISCGTTVSEGDRLCTWGRRGLGGKALPSTTDGRRGQIEAGFWLYNAAAADTAQKYGEVFLRCGS
jgi:hypothetical protein